LLKTDQVEQKPNSNHFPDQDQSEYKHMAAMFTFPDSIAKSIRSKY